MSLRAQVDPVTIEHFAMQVVGRERSYQSWFSDARYELVDGGICRLSVCSRFRYDWIKKQYLNQLEEKCESEFGIKLELILVHKSDKIEVESSSDIAEGLSEVETTTAVSSKKQPKKRRGAGRGFSFEQFIPGKENRLALAAARSIADDVGQHCSPLFIWGDHGLGKTHLASCIADAWPDSQVECLLAEEFGNAFVMANRSNERDHFQARIRSKKVLIVEDLDFFLEGNKRATIQELIHSIKILKREGRYIVLTSSRPLPDYKAISHQLYDLLLASLSVRLTKPGEPSRKALLENYLRLYGLKLTSKARAELEEVPFDSPTQIQGALMQLVAFARLQEEALDVQLVRDVLSDFQLLLSDVGAPIMGEDLHQLAKAVSKEFGVSIPKMLSKSRERYVCLARHMAMRLSYDAHFTLKEIGQFYGGRAHQTVLASIRRGQEMERGDKEMSQIYNRLKGETSA